jgi:hypothetical protein
VLEHCRKRSPNKTQYGMKGHIHYTPFIRKKKAKKISKNFKKGVDK